MQGNSRFIWLLIVHVTLLACGALNADFIQLHSFFPPILQNYWENGMIFWSFGLDTVVTDRYVRLTNDEADSCGYLWNRHVNRVDAFELNATVRLEKSDPSRLFLSSPGAGLGVWYSSERFTHDTDTALFGFKRLFSGVGVVLTHAGELILLASNKTAPVDAERLELHGSDEPAAVGSCRVPSPETLHLSISLRYADGVFSVFYVSHGSAQFRPEDYARAVACDAARVTLVDGQYRFGVSARNSDMSQARHEVRSVIMSPIVNHAAHEAEERAAERIHLFRQDGEEAMEKLVGSADNQRIFLDLMSNKGAVVPFFVLLEAYVKRGVGIDMVLKSLLGVFRLLSMHSGDVEWKQNYAAVAMSIINCRMLANHFRHVMSFSVVLKLLRQRPGSPAAWMAQAASFFFRTFEQIYGDLNYYQLTFMPHWSRARLSLGYRFFKSLSLTCGLLHELARARRPGGGEGEHFRATLISVVRYVCDMTVYYQWVPWYNPASWLQYACGSAAGFLGVYVVWKETERKVIAEQAAAASLSATEKAVEEREAAGKVRVANGAVEGTEEREGAKEGSAVDKTVTKKANKSHNDACSDRNNSCDKEHDIVHDHYYKHNGRDSNADALSDSTLQKDLKVDEDAVPPVVMAP